MAEQTFRSPGFFEQEIDLSARKQSPTGTPGGIIGTAIKGPAFVPVTVGSFADFETTFGSLDPHRFGPYAVREFLKHRNAVTYMRVLGAGANESLTDISNTGTHGIVKNAGFSVVSNDGSDNEYSGLPRLPEHVAGALNNLDANVINDAANDSRLQGGMQFIVARHDVTVMESEGFPVFTDNDSMTGEVVNKVNLIRASIMVASGTRVLIADGDQDLAAVIWATTAPNDYATIIGNGPDDGAGRGTFKLILSSSTGVDYGRDDGIPGLRVMTASLDPSSVSYIGKILNTDPDKFQEHEHLLWCDYAVEAELASVDEATHSVAVLRGHKSNYSDRDGDTPTAGQREYLQSFGRFDTRYTTPTTPWIISQPYGGTENELFRFESLSDGAWANKQLKVSIANLRASTDPAYEYGTFEVQIRKFSDTDLQKEVLESYPECNLDPQSDRYVARQIGDYKVLFDFDAEDDDERRIVISGKYPNRSSVVRVIMNNLVDSGDACLPKDMLPFGFRGVPALKTNQLLSDGTNAHANPSALLHADAAAVSAAEAGNGAGTGWRLFGHDPANAADDTSLAGGDDQTLAGLVSAIVPPLPLRFKCSRGAVYAGEEVNLDVTRDSGGDHSFIGHPGDNERADSRFYWGVKFTRTPETGSMSNAALNANVSSKANPLVAAYTRFQGIAKLDNVTTGSGADDLNNNKFTLARVAFSNPISKADGTLRDLQGATGAIDEEITGSVGAHMLEAAYIRNGVVDASTYCIEDSLLQDVGGDNRPRMTLATLVHNDKIKFNRFSEYCKFTTVFCGGHDGINTLDYDVARMNDRASSSDDDGKARSDFLDDGLLHAKDMTELDGDPVEANNTSGAGRENNIVASYRKAVDMMTDSMTVNTNILCVPGIRDTFVTSHAADRTKAYSKAIYLMDIPYFTEDNTRLFAGTPAHSLLKPDVRETSEAFESRALDNSYSATYFPDVYIDDPLNNLKVRVPASIAALASLAYNDKVAYPWFAPAGFNRGALDMVSNVTTRLTAGDRDNLYDSRINPIAVFPNAGFVIFGQKTMQMKKSALDRVNVRRMLLEVKRLIVAVANNILFEPNTPQTRARFIGAVQPLLALVQAQAGVESFQVVMDDTNNTIEDYDNNRLNGRIVVVPTRAIEFIAIDFIITKSGVMFE
jgi:hypothetical protein